VIERGATHDAASDDDNRGVIRQVHPAGLRNWIEVTPGSL
jgi:hypothetical protein